VRRREPRWRRLAAAAPCYPAFVSSIFVCSLEAMPWHVRSLRPGRLVSLLPAREQPPTPPRIPPSFHHRVEIDDVTEALAEHVLPEREHVEALIDFLLDWRDPRPLLVHCMAGISRSMAAALIAMAAHSPGREMEAARTMRCLAPHAHPNRRMIALADELLGCAGRLVEAREAMGPSQPLAVGPLVRLSRIARASGA
jgi:predicted protein tyrosine phosphatase